MALASHDSRYFGASIGPIEEDEAEEAHEPLPQVVEVVVEPDNGGSAAPAPATPR
jgi:hypothetical protein